MDKYNSIEHDFHKTPNVSKSKWNISNEKQLRLNKINEIKDYLFAKIRERELLSKNRSKYIASFEYFNKSLIFLLHNFYCIICICYWSTFRNNRSKLWPYIFNYFGINKTVFKNNKK